MDEQSLFESPEAQGPMAQRYRPRDIYSLWGQKHFLNDAFFSMIQSGRWSSLLFWGPPGTGKTSLALAVSQTHGGPFHSKSAVKTGVKELRDILEKSARSVHLGHLAHLLFVDELHRLNKAQQDVLLPYLEDGSVKFMGATTENPSFSINNAICSRSLIFTFKKLEKDEMAGMLKKHVPQDLSIDELVYENLARLSEGDGRRAFNLLEGLLLSLPSSTKKVELSHLKHFCRSQSLYYDKKSDKHFDTISAFIKSMRLGDADAALYYLAVMLEGGEDPLFIARRMMIFASEDVGNAQPMALVLAQSCYEGVHKIGMPEARILLAQTVTYLACSEKSNRSYEALEKALEQVRSHGADEIPLFLRNAPTSLMKQWGYSQGYKSPHHGGSGPRPSCLPEKLKGKKFYFPSDKGREKSFQSRPDPQG